MIWANLAVANLERTQKFYEAIGCTPNNPHTSNELVSFLSLQTRTDINLMSLRCKNSENLIKSHFCR